MNVVQSGKLYNSPYIQAQKPVQQVSLSNILHGTEITQRNLLSLQRLGLV